MGLFNCFPDNLFFRISFYTGLCIIINNISDIVCSNNNIENIFIWYRIIIFIAGYPILNHLKKYSNGIYDFIIRILSFVMIIAIAFSLYVAAEMFIGIILLILIFRS
jgi:hypothetical protein